MAVKGQDRGSAQSPRSLVTSTVAQTRAPSISGLQTRLLLLLPHPCGHPLSLAH